MSTSLPELSHSVLKWQCPGYVSGLVLMTRLLRVGNIFWKVRHCLIKGPGFSFRLNTPFGFGTNVLVNPINIVGLY